MGRRYTSITKKLDLVGYIWIAIFLLLPISIIGLLISKIPKIELLEIGKSLFLLKKSIIQAIFSSLLSTLLGILLGLCIFNVDTKIRNLYVSIISFIPCLPVIVVLLGFINVFGRHSWISYIINHISTSSFSLYSIKGIIAVHTYFNTPIIVISSLYALQQVASDQYKLICQLKLSQFTKWRWIILPTLVRYIGPSFAIVFVLCFSSFIIPMYLGGLETTSLGFAIYKEIQYEGNLPKASFLSLLHIFFSMLGVFFIRQYSRISSHCYINNFNKKHLSNNKIGNYIRYFIILISVILFLSPITSILINAIYTINFTNQILNVILWKSLLISLVTASISAISCITISYLILSISRKWRYLGNHKIATFLEVIPFSLLGIPSSVLALVAWTTFPYFVDNTYFIYFLLITSQLILTVPHAVSKMSAPMQRSMEICERLCLVYRIPTKTRISKLEIPILKNAILISFLTSFLLSLGEFNILVFFNQFNVYTLTSYLYEQMSNYDKVGAEFTAALIVLICITVSRILNRDRN